MEKEDQPSSIYPESLDETVSSTLESLVVRDDFLEKVLTKARSRLIGDVSNP